MTFALKNLRRDNRAASPAFSTIILTAAVIVMVLVAMTYASNILNSKAAQNEFNTNQQFMQTAGQQVDDIAWTIGRTQTISYNNRYGQITFEQAAVTYTVEVHVGTQWQTMPVSIQSGIILYNMPVDSYKMDDGYFQRLPADANNSILQTGSAAPITQVFATEKLLMPSGNYLRVAVVPTMRVLDSASTNCYKLYLPTLSNGTSHSYTQALTITGDGIQKTVKSGVDQIRITASFPSAAQGFDASFFNFHSVTETLATSANSLVELYVGDVQVRIG
jgi:type II secretory pathway pseudopilin PulG